MQWVNKVAIAAIAATCLAGGTRQDLPPRDLELVVFETQSCTVCSEFRQQIIRPYFGSDRGATLPMHVVDIDLLGTAGRALNAVIDTIPTTVLLDHGREIGRIEGNPDHDEFLKRIDALAATSG